MSAKAKFAVVLSGCGVYDGSEIHEAVLTLLAIDRAGCTYQCFAPDVPQMHVINHVIGAPGAETRNVLVESARIARGAILPLADYKPADFDILAFPGGFGAAKNLCTFAVDGPDCTVNPDAEKAIRSTHAAKKPIVALCIAPALVAKVLGKIDVTIGNDAGTAKAIAAMGGNPLERTHGEVCIDNANKIVTSPCYMLNATIGQIADGAAAAVGAALKLL
ncbi:MAG: isoprenoid biosynthesis glyoxalase ElbB [Rhodospirillaceae bacterium]